MKNLLALCSILFAIRSSAQVSIGADGISLGAGSILSAEGLTLTPQGNLSLTNLTFQKSTAPVNLGSGYSIAHVVYLNAPISFTGTVRFTYQESDLNGNAESQLLMAYQSSAVWATSPTSVVNTADNYVEETVVSKNFDGVTVSAINTTLPISLTSFTAKRQANASVLLKWVTASEQHNSHFSIERSSDGTHYETIGNIPALGSGNGPFSYSFSDKKPLEGTNYYRLIQYDLDGHEEIYGVRIVQTGNGVIALALYPNPVTSNFKLVMSSTPARPLNYSIQNVSGQVMQTGIISVREQWIETSGLSAGVYILSLENNQAVRFFKK